MSVGKGVLPELLDVAEPAEFDYCRLGIFGEKASDLAEEVLIVLERWRAKFTSMAGSCGHVDPGVLTWSGRLDLLESQRL